MNNMLVPTSQAAVIEAANCSFELLPYPPYLPDLAQSEFHKLKSNQRGQHFWNNDSAIWAVGELLE